jgi:UDP-N-acetylmuramoyl-L-alanyl-D-glutamate--2,6-diaminopimelate ligase
MKLKKLIKEITFQQIKGDKDVEVTGLCSNSKRVAPGNLFIAKRGRQTHGAQYIPQAIAAGAVAVLTDIYDPTLREVTQLIHPQIASIEAKLAAQYYQNASHTLFMVGVTGTNGKTTTTFLIKQLVDQLIGTCGLIGTIEYITGLQRYQATHTTPDVITNHKLLREMVLQGCKAAVMEVSSHSLDQGRTQYIDFDVGVFTNLTIEHMDYHGDMEKYCLAKQKLFTSITPSVHPIKKFNKRAIINADSPWHSKILEGSKVDLLSYGIDAQASLQATQIEMTHQGTSFFVRYQNKTAFCESPLVGRYNVYNTLAAIATLLVYGIPLEAIVAKVPTLLPVSGRLQPVPNALGLTIYVDYAHSEDALLNVLQTLKELKPRRIITVFGAGGDRDPAKRELMGKVANTHAQFSIITNDNPRSEDPIHIAQKIAQQFTHPDRYMVELDRFKAINTAIDLATPEDIVLIAGKGHETSQIFSHTIVEFDDYKAASQICLKKLQLK